jgi:hypothetical protein
MRLYADCHGSSNGGIDMSTLALDNACELGKWLYGTGQQYASEAQFGELKTSHAAFHRSAASIAAMIEGGKRAEAEALLSSPESEYCKLSVCVVGFLMGFRTRHGDT